MSNEKIRSVLKDVLEEEIPSSQVNLWPAVKTALLEGEHQPYQKGDKVNTLIPSRMPRFALTISLFLALLAVFLATPPGRSFAQSVLALFTPAEGTTFPLEDSQIAPEEPDETSPTALPPAPLISVAEAEEQVGFEIAELPDVPEGLEYLGARLYGNAVNIEYQTKDRGGHLNIRQSQEGYHRSEWDSVPADAIMPVKIGDLEGEFARGTFVVYSGETSATWNPEAAILRLRWIKDGVWFEMAKYGDVHAIEYLDRDELIKLAESLTAQP